jgi:predicted ATPase
LVVDNCEHVLDAAGRLVTAILAATSSVRILATSREALGLAAEHRWPVAPFTVDDGARSAAVELFTERALALNPDFHLGDGDDATTVVEICRRLDGIPLAIELAAARMVSMTPQDLFERLDDRFQVLSATPRGGRHHTLVQSVQWSYELLDEGERRLLDRCSVFSDGFDLHSATHLADGPDEYTVVEQLDSLVRKSLVNVDRRGAHARYGMLETIRQFAHERLATDGDGNEVRDRHAAYFAREAERQWERWDGPDQDDAIQWVVAELANLRAGFRWASDRGDVATATAIAAHAAMIGAHALRFEPVDWAVEALEMATAAGVPQLSRLFTAASYCAFIGRPEEALKYAQAAIQLEAAGSHDPFGDGWSGMLAAVAHFNAGRPERAFETLAAQLSGQELAARLPALTLHLWMLPVMNRSQEALAIADATLQLTRSRRNPFFIALALLGYGSALEASDPDRSLAVLREAHELTRTNRIAQMESTVATALAEVEARHGDVDRALELLDHAIASFHRGGEVLNVARTIADLAMLVDSRLDCPDMAATLTGFAMDRPHRPLTGVTDLPGVVGHVRSRLGDAATDAAIAAGAHMDLATGVGYARDQIAIVQRERAERRVD